MLTLSCFCGCFRRLSLTMLSVVGLLVGRTRDCTYTSRSVAEQLIHTFSSISQTWRFSQDANKCSSICSICLFARQLHHRDGRPTVHRYGSHVSNKPQISICKLSSAARNPPRLPLLLHGVSLEQQWPSSYSQSLTANTIIYIHCVSKNSGPLWYVQITPTNLDQYY